METYCQSLLQPLRSICSSGFSFRVAKEGFSWHHLINNNKVTILILTYAQTSKFKPTSHDHLCKGHVEINLNQHLTGTTWIIFKHSLILFSKIHLNSFCSLSDELMLWYSGAWPLFDSSSSVCFSQKIRNVFENFFQISIQFFHVEELFCNRMLGWNCPMERSW